jgi:hypothetical protein
MAANCRREKIQLVFRDDWLGKAVGPIVEYVSGQVTKCPTGAYF